MLLGCLGHIGWVTVSFFEWLSSHSKIDSLPHLIILNSIFKIYSHVQPLYSILIRCHDTSERERPDPCQQQLWWHNSKRWHNQSTTSLSPAESKFIGIKLSIRHTDYCILCLWLFLETKTNSRKFFQCGW